MRFDEFQVGNLGIPPERCWRLWMEGLSYKRISFKLYNEGLFNQRTQKRFTEVSIQKAVEKWMLHNLKDSKKDFLERQRNRGMIITEEQWKNWVAYKARAFFARRKKSLKLYVIRHGIQDYFKEGEFDDV